MVGIGARGTFGLAVAVGVVLIPPAPAVQASGGSGGRPATVVVQVVQREAWSAIGSGEARFLVRVEEVLHGWVPSSVVVVRVPEGGFGASLFEPGAALQVVLERRGDGEYRVRTARPHRPEVENADSFPPPIAVTPAEQPRVRALTPNAAFVQEVVELVNQVRWDYNNGHLPPLKQVDLLHNSAGTHSVNMATRDFFSHCDLDTGTRPGDRMTAAGYFWNAAGENIAAGYPTPTDVMNAWMGSSGHRANILSTTFRELGVGYDYQGSDTATVRLDPDGDCTADTFNQGPFFHYWTQNFGQRSSVYPVVINREAAETTTTAVNLYVYGPAGADEMCFSNDGTNWSAWEPYVADKAWTLSPGNGTKTVYARVRDGATVYEASDTIVLNTTCPWEDTLELTGGTVTGTEVYHRCVSIAAGPNYSVVSGGDLTCRAPTVVLRNGFSVTGTGVFTAGNQL